MQSMKKTVALRCRVCGNDQFSTIGETIQDVLTAADETEIECADCGHVATKEELIEDNSETINANIEDFKSEIVQEIEKDIKKMFK